MGRQSDYRGLGIFIGLLLCCLRAIPQPPSISYATPQNYTVSKIISVLAPLNTGGAVPPNAYLQVTTFAGNGSVGTTDGLGTAASFSSAAGVAVGLGGIVYVADNNNHLIRQITPAGLVSTLAGKGSPGDNDGQGVVASFYAPFGVVTDAAGNIYVADCFNNMIRRITPSGLVTTLAGNFKSGKLDGTGFAAGFNQPVGINIDANGNLYVADSNNNLIREVSPAGVVTTIAGTGKAGANNGAGNVASFNKPFGVALDSKGNIYVADYNNNLIRKINSSGIVSTFAGSGTAGATDGIGTAASFNAPFGLVTDAADNLYVADSKNNLLRKISPAGNVTTLAGSGQAGAADGVAMAASFNAISGLAFDSHSNMYIADQRNNLIRKLSLTGFAIDKPLPAGLTFDGTTGIISGTPTAVSPPTDYTVTAFNGYGSSSTVVNIQVNTVPVVLPADEAKMICDADFNDAATGGVANLNYLSSNTAVATISSAGIVHITGEGTTIISATDGFSTATQNITVVQAAAVSITASANRIPVGTAVTFTASVTGQTNGAVYQWSVNGTNTGTNSITFTSQSLNNADVVVCTLIPISGCVFSVNSQPIIMQVLTPIKVIPNTFTPNGDNINDIWDLSALVVEDPNLTVNVFDRDGSLIFHSQGYAHPWDGTLNGKPLPVATYYYLITIAKQKLAGTVTIVR